MPEDVYVDLAYQGIELGSQLCMQEFTESEAYVQCPHPMPVGSFVSIIADGLEIPVRVARVSEQVAGASRPAGMFVGASALEGQAHDWWMRNVSPALQAEGSEASEPTPSSEAVASEPEASPEEPEVQAAADPESEAPKEEAKPTKKKRRRRKKKA